MIWDRERLGTRDRRVLRAAEARIGRMGLPWDGDERECFTPLDPVARRAVSTECKVAKGLTYPCIGGGRSGTRGIHTGAGSGYERSTARGAPDDSHDRTLPTSAEDVARHAGPARDPGGRGRAAKTVLASTSSVRSR